MKLVKNWGEEEKRKGGREKYSCPQGTRPARNDAYLSNPTVPFIPHSLISFPSFPTYFIIRVAMRIRTILNFLGPSKIVQASLVELSLIQSLIQRLCRDLDFRIYLLADAAADPVQV